MEQIVVQIKDKDKAKVLFELLESLDFVDSVKTIETEENENDSTTQEESLDFFALAGLWDGRNITPESVRREAWPGQVE